MNDKICRTCGYTDCENVTGKIGYCPRWHVPESANCIRTWDVDGIPRLCQLPANHEGMHQDGQAYLASAPLEPLRDLTPDQAIEFADHTLTAIGRILEGINPAQFVPCEGTVDNGQPFRFPEGTEIVPCESWPPSTPKHVAPPVGSEAREATATPWIGRHRNG